MINIIGLGPSNKDYLSLKAIKHIHSGKKNYLRTSRHEASDYFREEGIDFESFDEIYEKSDNFDEVYKSIVKRLIEEGRKEEINYYVPGDPMIAEKTVELLIKSQEDINIVSGVSFIEPVLRAVGRDPLSGFKLLNAEDICFYDFDKDADILLTQVYNKRILSDVKLLLAEIYGDEYEIYFIKDAGLKSEVCEYIKIFELDRIEEANYQSSVYIPKSNDMSMARAFEISSMEDVEIEDEQRLADMIFYVFSALNKARELGYYNFYDILHIFCDKYAKKIEKCKKDVEKPLYMGYNGDELKKEMPFLGKSMQKQDKNPLKLAQEIIRYAISKGFAWQDYRGVFQKLDEEKNEVFQAIDGPAEDLKMELGDLIFTCVNICEFFNQDSGEALGMTTDKFIKRFNFMKDVAERRNSDLDDMTLDELEELWQEAKKSLNNK